MARARDPNRSKAFEIYKEHAGNIDLVEIASQLNISPGTIRGWKSKDSWEEQLNGTLHKNTERSKRKKGGQLKNKNAVGNDGGAPEQNKNAEKYGFFSKYLPEETREIFSAIDHADPLDLLWHQIQIAYAAIIRAQRIAYVKDQQDKTKAKIGSFDNGDTYMIQQAWDKQNEFLKAQARAQGELRALIKQYDEMLHKNWEAASEEQRARIAQIKAQTDKLTGNNQEIEDLDEIEGEIYGGDKK
ncbi:MAG: phage terminase small subunit [Lachnospiraceae bacterium]|nr:phage terminase small subunit [Lachnospiraceae bacterium]